MRAVSNRRDRWRAAVLRHRAPGMTGEVRALLLWVASHPHCGPNAIWSIPRTEIAEAFGVPEQRINERIKRAKDLGLLSTVKRGVRGTTAVYEGLVPPMVETTGWRGSKPNPKQGTSDRAAVEGTSGRSQSVVGYATVGRPHNEAPKGTSGRAATGSRDDRSPDSVTVAPTTGPRNESHSSKSNIRDHSERSSRSDQTASKKRRPTITIHNEGPEAERARQLRELEQYMQRVEDATSPAAHGLQETA